MNFFLFLFALLPTAALAADTRITVSDAWVREAPPGAAMLAAYMKIHNSGTTKRILTGVDSPRFDHVMLHKSVVMNGIAKMLHQDTIEIPPGGTLMLQPGSFHLMMTAPEKPLQRGQCVEFVLHMKNGENITVNATVKRAGDADS